MCHRHICLTLRRCGQCTPLFLWSCQRKSAVHRAERKTLSAGGHAAARECADDLESVRSKTLVCTGRTTLLNGPAAAFGGLGVGSGWLGTARLLRPAAASLSPGVESKGGDPQAPSFVSFQGGMGETAEAPPVAEKARRFRGSGTIGGHKVAGNRIAATVGKLFSLQKRKASTVLCTEAVYQVL